MQEANLAKTPKYFKKTYVVEPNQEVQDVLPVCYGVNLATINPLYGLGFVEFSLDSGNYLPIIIHACLHAFSEDYTEEHSP